jgi:hypothetical protein
MEEGEEEKSDKEGHDAKLDNSSSGDKFSKAAGGAVRVVATMIGLVIVGLFELIFLFVLALQDRSWKPARFDSRFPREGFTEAFTAKISQGHSP